MRFSAIIFDFDGVIVDSEILSNSILAETLTGIGHPTTTEQAVERYIGLNWRDAVAVIEAEIGHPLPAGFREKTKAAFQLRLDEVAAVAGVEAFLDRIPAIPKAVASSSPTAWLRSALERFELAHHFGGRLFSAAEHVTLGKPHPDIYLHAARALCAPPEDVLVFEDTAPGVRAAKAAGMTVIGLCAGRHCGPDHGDRLGAAGADRTAQSYAEALDIMD